MIDRYVGYVGCEERTYASYKKKWLASQRKLACEARSPYLTYPTYRPYLSYSVLVARGWESKNVEAQQADREQGREAAEPVSAEEAARAARRKTLELTRARALADLGKAKSPEHRAMLEAAVRALDEQLQNL